MSIPPYPSPFLEAAPYYRFRAPYAPEAIAYVRSEFDLDENARLLDLGCGTATLSIPFSRMVGEVVAVDPDAGMLDEGRRQAAEAGRTNITWVHARAEDVHAALGMFSAVTMGQSFHWMERDRVLEQLAPMICTDGGIALIGPSMRRPQESWEHLATEVVSRYLGAPVRHPRANPDEPENSPALRRATHFSNPTSRVFRMPVDRDIPSIIGWVYSISHSRRSLFGDRLAEFERELTEVLSAANSTGIFHEEVETEVVIVRNRQAGAGRI